MFAFLYVQIWQYFLAYSTIISRQGSATCYQITLVKNLNSTHRIEGVPSQYGLSGALRAAKFRFGEIAASRGEAGAVDDDDEDGGDAKEDESRPGQGGSSDNEGFKLHAAVTTTADEDKVVPGDIMSM
jgi:hypothetical protein